jgi:major intracellular serine protease
MFAMAAEKDIISTLPELPGICLWRPGHVGVYIGNNQVIEARGTKYGVVKTALSEGNWTYWWKCPGIEYEGVEDMDFSFLDDTGRQHYYKHGYKGQGVTVAVIDSGINPHPELDGKVIEHHNFSPEKEHYDYFDHGTHVAGSIAGTNCGVAPEVKIISLKVANSMGEINTLNVIEALQWCYKNRDRIDLVSMSLAGDGGGLLDLYEAMINQLVYANIPVIVAAGNTGDERPQYPAHFQEVICVGAVDREQKHAMFSTQSDEVDVCQLGVGVLSCNNRGGYSEKTGTSMATPLVSGIAALILCRYKHKFGKRMPEPELYHKLKFENTVDVDIPGIDKRTGAGFVSLKEISEYKDFNKISDWAREAVEELKDLGIMQGSGEKFRPKDSITREELATVIYRTIQYLKS